MASALCVVAESQFKLSKAPFKVVQDWEQACSWLKKGQMSGRGRDLESNTSFGKSCFIFKQLNFLMGRILGVEDSHLK